MSVMVPNSVTIIGDKAFYGCSGLTSITLPNGVKRIGISLFEDCSNLTSVTIPNSVTSIDDYAFFGCSRLTSINCWTESVPATGTYVFYNVPQSTATLYVPESSLEAYITADQWKEFGTILPIDPTDIEELKSSEMKKVNKNAPTFDLNGRMLSKKPVNGYYIQGGKKFFVK